MLNNFIKLKKFIFTGILFILIISCGNKKIVKKIDENTLNSASITQNNTPQFNANYQNYNQKITIINKSKKTIANFSIAVVDTPDLQRVGLSNLKSLPSNYGMLFLKNFIYKQ